MLVVVVLVGGVISLVEFSATKRNEKRKGTQRGKKNLTAF